jgi:hypothetical protein
VSTGWATEDSWFDFRQGQDFSCPQRPDWICATCCLYPDSAKVSVHRCETSHNHLLLVSGMCGVRLPVNQTSA